VNPLRKSCHDKNKREQNKRDEPLCDGMSTMRRECVGTHFACGCFRQWESEYFSDLKKCVTTEEKSSRKATKLDARQRIAVDSILNSYRDPPQTKTFRTQDASYQSFLSHMGRGKDVNNSERYLSLGGILNASIAPRALYRPPKLVGHRKIQVGKMDF
jgi:hypothetical protein